MTDPEVDLMVLTAAPYSNAEVDSLQLDRELQELCNGIVHQTRRPSQSGRRVGRGRRRLVLGVAVGIVLSALLAALATIRQPTDGTGSGTAYAQEVVELARQVPRLLVQEPGWEVTYVSEMSPTEGKIHYGDGKRAMNLTWSNSDPPPTPGPARSSQGVAIIRELTINGSPAEIYLEPALTRERCEASGNQDCANFEFSGLHPAYATWNQDGYDIYLSTAVPSVEELKGLLAALKPVSVEEWLAALPENIVNPGEYPEVVAELLRDVPLPDDFDAEPLKSGDLNRPRRDLAVDAIGAVSCRWMEIWVEATDEGNEAAAQRAVQAMASSHEWDALVELNEIPHPYAVTVWGYADAMTRDQIQLGPRTLNGPTTVRNYYKEALQCGPERKDGMWGPYPQLGPMPGETGGSRLSTLRPSG